MAPQAVAEFVAEGGDTVEAGGVLFEGTQGIGQRGSTGSPPFAVDENRGVHGIERFADFAHGFQVVDAHEVEAEPVNMVFLGPIHD